MMEQAATAICSSLLILGIWWLYFQEYLPYRLDKTRQDLFRVRDDLFEYWDENGLSFDSEAYGILRQTINSMIRHAHKTHFLSLPGLIAVVYISRKYQDISPAKDYYAAFKRGLNELPFDARKQLLHAQEQMHTIVLQHVVFSSLFLTVLYWVGWVFQVTGWISNRLLRSKPYRNTWAAVDAQASEITDDPLRNGGSGMAPV